MLIGACSDHGAGEPLQDEGQAEVLRLAITTSTRDSGLIDVLVPPFEDQYEARVMVIAVGTGQAMKLGEQGEVDVVLVHAPEAEHRFMQAGHGARHEQVMFNTFELVGPADDPAHIRDLPASAALQAIAVSNQRFISRGDNSGTNQRELAMWQSSGGLPTWEGYIESGRGMGATLIMADQMRAYTLTDRGTRLAHQNKIDLENLVSASEELLNTYGAMTVNPTKHGQINGPLANSFLDFLISPKIQTLIGQFTVSGQPLFYPMRQTELYNEKR